MQNVAFQTGNPQQVLQKYPSVGKLLGELYENTVVLLSGEVFHTVVRCSLALANCSSTQGRNTRKARDWVQTQLRRVTTPTLKNSNLVEIGEYWGYTAQQATEIMLDKLVSSLCHDQEIMKSFTWNDEERGCYPHKPISGLCLRELSDFCLPLVTLKQAQPLIEKILCCQKSLDLISSWQENGFYVADSVSLVFLKAVASSKELLLSYDARTALWKRYQPSFESEILDLIEMSIIHRPYISRTQLRDAISSSGLPRACAENPELFTVAMSLFSSFLVRSGGNTQAVKLLSVFGELCVEECKQGNQQVFSTSSQLFPSFCRSLVQKMAINPQDVKSEAFILDKLQSVSMELDELAKHLSKSELFAVWTTLWCFPSWESHVLGLVLTSCRDEVLDGCINVLCWLHVPPMTDTHISVKAALKEVLPSLRLLQSKTRLQFADLQYVLCTSPILCGPDAAILLGRLLMVFLCNAVGGHLVFRSVVQMLTQGLSALERLSVMLDYFENSFLEKKFLPASSNDQKKARQRLCKEIDELLSDARQELVGNQHSAKQAMFTESRLLDNYDTIDKDLLARAETVFRVLQCEENTEMPAPTIT